MSNVLTLTTEHLAVLRADGDTAVQAGTTMVRVMRDGSGYRPLRTGTGEPCPNQLVLSQDDLDLIEQQPEGLVCADASGTTGWTVRVEVPA